MSEELEPIIDAEVVESDEVISGEYWDEALGVIDEMGHDLELALNCIRQYQRALNMLCASDPNGIYPQIILQKYNMHHKKSNENQMKKPQLGGPRKELPRGDD